MNRSVERARLRLTGGLLGLLIVAGCESPGGPAQPVPGPRAGTTRPANTPNTSTKPSQEVKQASGAGRSTGGDIGFYQLVLVSEPSPAEAPPGVKHLRLSKATARGAGELLAMLCMPTGSSGVENRFAMIYPSEAEWKAAESWGSLLDTPAQQGDQPKPSMGGSTLLQWASGVVYGSPAGHPKEAERLRDAAGAMEDVLRDKAASVPIRWVAGTIAGHLRADRLFDYETAERVLLEAESLAPAESLERITTTYARAQAMIQNGKPAEARALLTELAGKCERFRESEVCLRARQVLASFDRRK